MSHETEPHLTTRNPGRHPVNVAHLVAGLLFLGLLGVWALFESGAVADNDLRWLLPVPWVLAGVVGLVVATVVSRRDREFRTTPTEEIR